MFPQLQGGQYTPAPNRRPGAPCDNCGHSPTYGTLHVIPDHTNLCRAGFSRSLGCWRWIRQPGAATRPTPLDYTMTTLPNGMSVVFLEDHSTPIVHAEVWYHVGSKNEKPGRTGFAHLFEHMMFKGSKNVEPEGHPSWISSIGGQSNAYTNEDATVFWETTPAQYLPLVLWLEADRLASLRIDEDVFKTEREVVKEERRMRHRQPAVRPAERAHLRPGVHRPSLQAPDDRQHAGSRGGVGRRRARLLPDLLRAEQRDASCWSATSTRRRRWSW